MVDRRQEKDDRHCFDSMVILVCWMLWKERNDKTSDRSVRTLAEVLDWVVDEIVAVAEPPELFQLKCFVHHHKDNTDSNALQTEQFLVCRSKNLGLKGAKTRGVICIARDSCE